MPVVGFQMDPFAQLQVATDSTLCLAFEAQRRGYRLFAFQPAAISTQKADCVARGVWFTMPDPHNVIPGAAETIALNTCAVIWMRQDPPFDMAYIAATYALAALAGSTTVLNDPRAVRDTPEKWLMPRWNALIPDTCVSADVEALCAFHAVHARTVGKPLFGHAGYDVAVFDRAQDTEFRSFAQRLTVQGIPMVAQEFLPGIVDGDKRVLLVNGDVLGAFRRMPQSNDFRANLRLGAMPQTTTLTARERMICEVVGRQCAAEGLFLVGLDLIQEKLIEVNVTSPTGLVTLDQLYGKQAAGHVWDTALSYRQRTLGKMTH